jgi:Flagellar protein FliT
MMNTPPPATPFVGYASSLHALLQQALADAEDGLSPDLDLLQGAIVDLCARAGDLPADERPAAREATEKVLAALDTLTALLMQQRDALQQELGTVTSSKQAAKAYLKAKKD